MDNKNNFFIKSITTILIVVVLFSCKGKINKVREMDAQQYDPQTVEKKVNLIYTDSGKVSVKLKSPKLLDYSNLDFPFREFPDGINVVFYDDNDRKNTVVADYAITYSKTNLVDLRGNVKIVTGDSTILNAKQLYWDQSRNWVFSDQEYTIKMTNGAVNDGKGFDANENFDNFISRSNKGVQYIEEKDQ